jgi:hypothetical protein
LPRSAKGIAPGSSMEETTIGTPLSRAGEAVVEGGRAKRAADRFRRA